jgi:hypothetical protein
MGISHMSFIEAQVRRLAAPFPEVEGSSEHALAEAADFDRTY